MSPMLSAAWDTHGALQDDIQEAPGRGQDGRRKDGAWLGMMSQGLVPPQAGLWSSPLLPNASLS